MPFPSVSKVEREMLDRDQYGFMCNGRRCQIKLDSRGNFTAQAHGGTTYIGDTLQEVMGKLYHELKFKV